MGVNIYLVPQPTHKEWETMAKAVFNRDLHTILSVVVNLNEPIHIGKSSPGWQFLFVSNPDCYNETRESIESFLIAATRYQEYSLEDEYGEHITPDTFWKNYVDSCKDLKKSGDRISDNLCFINTDNE